MLSAKGKSRLLTILVLLFTLMRTILIDIAPKCIPISILFMSSCADERPPTGGRKDSLPPKIKYAFPENKTVNFNTDKITIRFSEFIQQSLDPKEILISPPMDKKPKIMVDGKNLFITLKSKLKDSTTYTINFGDAIKDNNEGNVFKNFTYVFSTGPLLDSASLSGTISNAADSKDVDNIIVTLHPIDSIDGIRHSKPFYFAKTDKSGNYIINNIHSGTYKIHALKDLNLNYIYDLSDELIGYSDTALALSDSSKAKRNLTVFLSVNSKPKFTDAISLAPGKVVIIYNSAINTLKLSSDVGSNKDITEVNDKKDSITYWNTAIYTKKMKLNLVANDTLADSTTVDLKTYNQDSSNNNKKYSLSFESQISKSDSTGKIIAIKPVLSPFKSLLLNLSRPVDSIDRNKRLVIVNDSTLKRDTIGFVLGMKNRRKISIDYFQKEKTPYTLVVPDSTFQDIFGWWNRRFYYKWISDANENYGNIILSLKFDHPEKHYVFKILDQDNIAVEIFYFTGNEKKKVTIKNIKAGSYHLQAIDDVNNNGEWDSGDFNKKIQPEKIINFRETYEVKGNWDLEIEVKL